MDGFSLDDVRDTFTSDMDVACAVIVEDSNRLSQYDVENVIQSLTGYADPLQAISDTFHKIRGTSSLVDLEGLCRLSTAYEEACEEAIVKIQDVSACLRSVAALSTEMVTVATKMSAAVPGLLDGDRANVDASLGDLALKISQQAHQQTNETDADGVGVDLSENQIPMAAQALSDDSLAYLDGDEPTSFDFAVDDPDPASGSVAEDNIDQDSAEFAFHDMQESFSFVGNDGSKNTSAMQEIYAAEYKDACPQLKQALSDTPDYQMACRFFHQLKGAAATVGLKAISQAASYGERLCETQELAQQHHDELVQLVDELNPTAGEEPSLGLETSMNSLFWIEVEDVFKQFDAWNESNTLADHWQSAGTLFHRLVGSALIAHQQECAQYAKDISDWFNVTAVGTEMPDAIVAAIRALLAFKLPNTEETGDQFQFGSEQSPVAGLAIDPVGEGPSLAEETAGLAATPVGVEESEASELWKVFQIESADLRQMWEEYIGAISDSDDPHELVRGLMRCAHTWKGAASSLGLSDLADVLSACEDFFESRLDGEFTFAADEFIVVSAQALRCVDTASHHQGMVDDDLFATLQKTITELGVPASSAPSRNTPVVSLQSIENDSRSGSSVMDLSQSLLDKSLRIPVDKVERLIDGMSELMVKRARMQADINNIHDLQKTVRETYDRLVIRLDAFSEKHEFSIGGVSTSEKFQAAEWDKYDAINVLARSVKEMGDDFLTSQQQMRNCLDGLNVTGRDFSAGLQNLQSDVGDLRTVSLRMLFNRLRLTAMEAASSAGKLVSVELVGQDNRLDKLVVDRLYGPLTHVVRNAIAHGIEFEKERHSLGKEEEGKLKITAHSEAGTVILRISDDGRGIDRESLLKIGREQGLIDAKARVEDSEVLELIFQPGLTTSKTVDELSGRGFGCDILKQEILQSGGSIDVETETGLGTAFTMTLPISVAVTRVLFVKCGEQLLALPLQHVERVYTAEELDADGMLTVDGEVFSLKALTEELDIPTKENHCRHLLLCQYGNKRALIGVSAIHGRDEIVVREVGSFLRGHPAFTGMTISSTGLPVLILDAHFLINGEEVRRSLRWQFEHVSESSPATTRFMKTVTAEEEDNRCILVVDDSLSVRKVAERYLSGLPHPILFASNGREALDIIREHPPRLIFSDLEMPVMDGLSLMRSIRSMGNDVPIVVVSSRSSEKHRQAAFTAGATAYLAKPFDQMTILKHVDKYAYIETSS